MKEDQLFTRKAYFFTKAICIKLGIDIKELNKLAEESYKDDYGYYLHDKKEQEQETINSIRQELEAAKTTISTYDNVLSTALIMLEAHGITVDDVLNKANDTTK